MKNIILILVLGWLSIAQAITPADLQSMPSQIQMLNNGGFENGTANWTASAGTFTSQTATKIAGKAAGAWALSAATGTLSQDVPTPGAVSMSAACFVNTTSASFQICSRTGGVAGSCYTAPSTGKWSLVSLPNFTGPSSGTVGIQVSTTGSTTGTAYIDGCYLGPAQSSSSGSSSGSTGINYLLNSSFEGGAGSWTVSNATSSVNTSNFHDGTQSIALAPSAAGSFYQDVTPLTNLSGTNMEAGMWVNTTTSGVTVCARVGGVTLSGNYCNAVPTTGTWQYVNANFIGPASGSVGAAVVWTGSTGSILVDQAYVGQATNLSQVSQARLVGTITMTGCAAMWSTSSTVFADFAATTGCSYAVTGSALAPSTMIPAIKFASLPPGEYKLEYEGLIINNVTGKNAYFQFSDGTNAARETSAVSAFVSSGGVSVSVPSFSQSITYTTAQSNVTLSIRGKVDSGDTSFVTGQTAYPGVIRVYYYPSQSQLAVQSQCASSGSCINHLSAYFSNWAVTSVQNVPWVTNANTRAGVGNYTIPFVSGFFSVAPNCIVQGVNGQSAIASISTSSVSIYLWNVSGTLTDGAFTLNCDKQGADQTSMSAPILVGSVTSGSAGAERVERILFGGGGTVTSPTSCTGSPCTTITTSSSWVSSITRSGAGIYVVNFAAGTWSAPPLCVIQPECNSLLHVGAPTGKSASLVNVTIYNLAGAAADDAVTLTCTGPK
jgi:hypothetical protein